MSASPGALGLLWLWAIVTDLGPAGQGHRLTIEWTVDLWRLDQSAVVAAGGGAGPMITMRRRLGRGMDA
jgi:hypothetical protein